MTAEEVLLIMTWLDIVIKVGCIIIGLATAIIIVGPRLKKAIADRKNATTAEEKARADAEIKDCILTFIGNVEESHTSLNNALKSIGESGAGKYKKDAVMTQTREFCDEKGYEYNKQEVSDYIDKVVELTKKVN